MVTEPQPEHRAGFVAIIGLPNAGKSTLMNALVGAKLAIATHKVQTTRHQILGIVSDEHSQIVFLDTPGVIEPTYRLQEKMMGQVQSAARDADMILHLADVRQADAQHPIVELLEQQKKPSILVLNKCDTIDENGIQDAETMLERLFPYQRKVRISAKTGDGLDDLKAAITGLLLPSPPFYPKDQLSEHPERFFVSELIREQIFLQFGQEIPYSCTVTIADFREETAMDHIFAEIVVNRTSQKGMLIGKNGSALKKLGTEARKQIEAFTGRKANLQLFVKVREKWRDNETYLKGYGY